MSIFVPNVVIIAGSDTDDEIIRKSKMLDSFQSMGITYTLSYLSAHRHPEWLKEYCLKKKEDGTMVFIGIAGMSAALPGDMAAILKNERPVIGVPLIASDGFDGMDALMSMVRLPAGTAIAISGIGKSGLNNAAILAAQIIAVRNIQIKEALKKFLIEKARTKPPQPDFETYNGTNVKRQGGENS